MNNKDSLPKPPHREDDDDDNHLDGSVLEQKNKTKYLYDFFELARRVVIPGRDGDHIYMFYARAGLYLVDSFYFIEVIDAIFKVGETTFGQPVEELGKIILVATLHNKDVNPERDNIVRGYKLRESDFKDSKPYVPLSDRRFYFDAATAQVFHRYSKEKVKVFDENDNLLEEEYVSGRGVELNKLLDDEMKKIIKTEIEYPEYA